jgi:hypothetical protein
LAKDSKVGSEGHQCRKQLRGISAKVVPHSLGGSADYLIEEGC